MLRIWTVTQSWALPASASAGRRPWRHSGRDFDFQLHEQVQLSVVLTLLELDWERRELFTQVCAVLLLHWDLLDQPYLHLLPLIPIEWVESRQNGIHE